MSDWWQRFVRRNIVDDAPMDDERVNEHGNVIDYGPQFGEDEDG